MTITSIPADDRYERFVASGGQTVFPYNFPIYADADITVSRERAGVATTLAYGTDYTVSGAGTDAAGNVTLTAGATAGDIIVLAGSQAVARTTSFANGGDFNADDVNAEFNRLVIVLQQLLNAQSRTMRLPTTDPATVMELPKKADRLGKVLGFDAVTGQPAAVAAPGPSGLITSTFMATVLSAADAAALRSAFGATALGDALITAANATAAAAAFGGGAEVAAFLAAASASAARGAIGAAPSAAPTFTGQARMAAGTLAAPALALGAAQDGFWIPTAGEIGIASGGAEMARFQPAGLKLGANATDAQHAMPRRQVGWEVISESVSASALATVTFGSLSTSFLAFRLEIDDLTPATANQNLQLLVSDDGGSTWKAANYSWAASGHAVGVGYQSGGSGSTSAFQLNHNPLGNTGFAAKVEITQAGLAKWLGAYLNNTPIFCSVQGGGRYTAAIVINGLRLIMSSGNVASHRVRLLGRR